MERKGKERTGLVLFAALIAAVAFMFAGCPNGDNGGGPEDYKGFAFGRNSARAADQTAGNGIPVTVTVDGGKITKVEYTGTYTNNGPGETPAYIDAMFDTSKAPSGGVAGTKTFNDSVVANQNFDGFISDAAAGATMALWGLMAAGQEAAEKGGITTTNQVLQGSATIGTGNDTLVVNILVKNKVVQDMYTTTRDNTALAMVNTVPVLAILASDGFDDTKLAVEITDTDTLAAFVAAGKAALAKAK